MPLCAIKGEISLDLKTSQWAPRHIECLGSEEADHAGASASLRSVAVLSKIRGCTTACRCGPGAARGADALAAQAWVMECCSLYFGLTGVAVALRALGDGESGLPRRIRPGFWDNNGRCCGTAGVLALACDRIAERGDDFGFADVLAGDLAARATVDDTGVRWSNHEHRATWSHAAGGRWETPAPSASSCATPGTRSAGPITRAPATPSRPRDHPARTPESAAHSPRAWVRWPAETAGRDRTRAAAPAGVPSLPAGACPRHICWISGSASPKQPGRS